MKTVFTTGQIAKICQVAPRTVSKWIDSGLLRGHRVPGGSLDRRVFRQHLMKFLVDNGLPVDALTADQTHKILLIGVDTNTAHQMTTFLGGEGFVVDAAEDSFTVGMKMETMHPDCIIIDCSAQSLSSLLIARQLRCKKEYEHIPVIGLLNVEQTAGGANEGTFSETFRKPFDVALLARRARCHATGHVPSVVK